MCCGSWEDESEMDFCQVTMRRNARRHCIGGTLLRRHRLEEVAYRSRTGSEEKWRQSRAGMKRKACHGAAGSSETENPAQHSPWPQLEPKGAHELEVLWNFSPKKKQPWPSRGWVTWSRCYGRKIKVSTEKIFNKVQKLAGQSFSSYLVT